MSKNQRTKYHCGSSQRGFLELSAYPDEHKVYISVISNRDQVRLDRANARRLAKAILECVGEEPKFETTEQALNELRARLKAPPYNACVLADKLLDVVQSNIMLNIKPNNHFGRFSSRVADNIRAGEMTLHEAGDVNNFLKKYSVSVDGQNYLASLMHGIKNLVDKVMPELAGDD